MTSVVLGMLFALAIALAVVGLVAVPARREGRELLTPQGEQLVQSVAGAARLGGTDEDSERTASGSGLPERPSEDAAGGSARTGTAG